MKKKAGGCVHFENRIIGVDKSFCYKIETGKWIKVIVRRSRYSVQWTNLKKDLRFQFRTRLFCQNLNPEIAGKSRRDFHIYVRQSFLFKLVEALWQSRA